MMMRFILLLFIVLVSSCTVTKRVHRPGYHVEWHKNYSNSAKAKKEKTQVLYDDSSETVETDESIRADESITAEKSTINPIEPLIEEVNNPSEVVPVESQEILDAPKLDELPVDDASTDQEHIESKKTNDVQTNKTSKTHIRTNKKLPNLRRFFWMDDDEKKLLLGSFFFLLLLGLTLIMVMHFTGAWLFLTETMLGVICISWLVMGFVVAYFTLESTGDDFRLGFRILFWFMKGTLYALFGCLMLGLLALAIYGLYYFGVLMVGLFILIGAYWETLVVIILTIAICGLITYLVDKIKGMVN